MRVDSSLTVTARETIMGCRSAEAVGAELHGFNTSHSFIAEKDDALFAVQDLELVLCLGRLTLSGSASPSFSLLWVSLLVIESLLYQEKHIPLLLPHSNVHCEVLFQKTQQSGFGQG